MSTDTEQSYPRHYTENDIKIIAYLKQWMAQKECSQAELCRRSVVKDTTMSQILSGKYITSPSRFLKKAYETTVRNDEADTKEMPSVKTGLYELAFAACEHARVFKGISVLSAWVGSGKTHSLRDYCNQKENAYMIEVIETMRVSSFIDDLVMLVLGNDQKGSSHKKLQLVIAKLKDTDSVFILDEAEKAKGDILEVVRRIRDIARIGVVLSGTENLHGVVSAGRGQFHQIGSRCSFVPAVIKGIQIEDTAALIQAAFDNEITESNYPAVIETVHRLSKGSARMVVESFIRGLKRYKSQSVDGITAQFVNQIAKEVLKMKVDDTKKAA